MRVPIAIFAIVLVATGGSLAQAQFYGSYYGGGTPGSYADHGYADIVRSAGTYNVLTSEAYINMEEARRLNIQNRMSAAHTFFEMRKMNREYRKAEYDARYPPKKQEDFIRYAQQAAPRRLGSSQLDPITGYVAWPRLLLGKGYADLRGDLEKLYAERANAAGAIGNDTYFDILKKTHEMMARLQKTIRKVPPNDYLKARNFINSMSYEARFSAG